MAKSSSYFYLIAIFIVIVVLILLGNWQLQRLHWKLDLIERIENRIRAELVMAPGKADWDRVTTADYEYLRVVINGEFIHEKETLIWAVTELGNGYWVLTPLKTESNEIILINRGFVPIDKAEKKYRINGLIEGEVTVKGLLRITEPKGIVLRKNDPDNNHWYSRDVEAIAKARILNNVAPYFIDADAGEDTKSLPIGGLTRINFRNPHLIYAITWYGLAILIFIMTIFAIKSSKQS